MWRWNSICILLPDSSWAYKSILLPSFTLDCSLLPIIVNGHLHGHVLVVPCVRGGILSENSLLLLRMGAFFTRSNPNIAGNWIVTTRYSVAKLHHWVVDSSCLIWSARLIKIGRLSHHASLTHRWFANFSCIYRLISRSYCLNDVFRTAYQRVALLVLFTSVLRRGAWMVVLAHVVAPSSAWDLNFAPSMDAQMLPLSRLQSCTIRRLIAARSDHLVAVVAVDSLWVQCRGVRQGGILIHTVPQLSSHLGPAMGSREFASRPGPSLSALLSPILTLN